MTTISGITFNFSESGYIPPSWSGSETYNFGVLFGTTYQVHIDTDGLVHAATDVGLKIYNSVTDSLYAFINNYEGFTSVAGNDTTIYLGTPYNGVKYINTTCISGSDGDPYDLSSCLMDLDVGITSSGVKYLHAFNNNLGVCTTSGVDFIKLGYQGYISSTTITGTRKCFVTDNDIYYTLVSGTTHSLNKKAYVKADWQQPDLVYTAGSGIINSTNINDIFVTISTAEFGGNTLFMATNSGIYAIDEDTGFYNVYYTE